MIAPALTFHGAAGTVTGSRYADLAANLKHALQKIDSNERRAEAVARMRQVIDQFASHRARRKRA